MLKKLLVVSQYFYPEQFRINDLTKEWIKRGFEVQVLTGLPNYPEGKLYPGYSLLNRRVDSYDSIPICRLPIVPRGQSSIKLILNYVSFVLSGFFWSVFTRQKADAVFVYEVSPITQALPAIWYARRKKIPLILYVMDLWPESFQATTGNKNPVILAILEELVRHIYKKSSTILVSSKSFIPSIINKGVSDTVVHYWPQYAEDFYSPRGTSDSIDGVILKDGLVNITFTGNIGVAQGLDVLVNAALILKDRSVPVRFNLIGDGRYLHQLIQKCSDVGVLESFNFIGRKPATSIPEYLASSDAALVCLAKEPLFALTLPAKVQSYLACGIPLLGSADGEVQRVIHESKAGFCADAGDPAAFADIVERFVLSSMADRRTMADNALKYYKDTFSKDMLLKDFDKMINQLGGA